MEKPDDTEKRIWSHGELEGYIRKDAFGRVFIDSCPTDQEHMVTPIDFGEERRSCRTYLEDLMVPDSILGNNVKVKYMLNIVHCSEN